MNSLTIQIADNSERHLSENELCHLETLKKLAEPTIANLSLDEHPNLLIFPQNLDVYGDKIGDSHIFEMKGERMVTGNIMGFIGCGNTKLSISSRFAQGKDDFFLQAQLFDIGVQPLLVFFHARAVSHQEQPGFRIVFFLIIKH